MNYFISVNFFNAAFLYFSLKSFFFNFISALFKKKTLAQLKL